MIDSERSSAAALMVAELKAVEHHRRTLIRELNPRLVPLLDEMVLSPLDRPRNPMVKTISAFELIFCSNKDIENCDEQSRRRHAVTVRFAGATICSNGKGVEFRIIPSSSDRPFTVRRVVLGDSWFYQVDHTFAAMR